MIRIRLCQKLPLKFNCVRAPSSTVAASALSIDSFPSAPCNTPSSTTTQLIRCSHKRNAASCQLTVEPYEKPQSFDNDFFPQSITPYRFDNVPNHDLQTGTTRVQVLEQWKQLLESLNTIVEGFHCAGTAVQDVLSIRLALERHHLVKLLVKPYSYTAEDVFSSVSRQSSSYVFPDPQDVKIGSFERNEENDDITEESVIDTVNIVCAAARSASELSEFRRRSCINQLEHESLRAVMVLTTGAWKHVASCEGIGLTLARSAEAQWTDISPVMMCQVGGNETRGKEPTESKGQGRPNRDQLDAVQDYMAENLPKIFVKFHSYDIYTNDVVFENNWYLDKSYVTVGTLSYALEIAKLRLFVHLRYANVKMQLLKSTTHEADGTVRIRWRISGIPQAKAIMFWKFLPWASKSSMAENFEWLDGFSTFFVNNTGLIYKHRMDRVIPDEGPELIKNQTVIEKIATKIASPPPAATVG